MVDGIHESNWESDHEASSSHLTSSSGGGPISTLVLAQPHWSSGDATSLFFSLELDRILGINVSFWTFFMVQGKMYTQNITPEEG